MADTAVSLTGVQDPLEWVLSGSSGPLCLPPLRPIPWLDAGEGSSMGVVDLLVTDVLVAD